MVNRTLLLLALLLAPAGAAGQREVAKAIDAVSRGWRDGASPERLAALQDLAQHDDPRCVDAVLELLARGEQALFPTARRVLGGYGAAKSQERIVEQGLRHTAAIVREQVLLALGEGRPGGLDWRAAARAALDDLDPRVRAAAVHALGRARDSERLERILELAADPAERVRLEVPEALARLAGLRTLPTLGGLLADGRWRVRLAAARALADLRQPQAVALLVERLAVEPGRLREDLLALLQRLTGRDFALDVQAWRDFLADAPADFLRQGDDVALARLAPPRYTGGGLRYHSIGTLSRRFVLLTDLSGSMETPLPQPAQAAGAARARLAVAQGELERLIGAMTAAESFDLVTFRDAGRAWRGHPVPADEHTRKAAVREVQGWTAGGATNVHAALALVFDMAESALESAQPSEDDVDTLFLLSDGAPSAGDVRHAPLLLEYVAERNRTLQLRVHCISLAGEIECRDFLQRLAALGNGQYVELAEAP